MIYTSIKLEVGVDMIITSIYVDNLCSFKDTTLDLTLKRLSKNSLINYEYLEGRENFYFRRVCILSGVNASGKTSIGRVLALMQTLLLNPFGALEHLKKLITYKDRVAKCILEFAIPSTYNLHRIELSLHENDELCEFKHSYIYIKPTMSAYQARKLLDKQHDTASQWEDFTLNLASLKSYKEIQVANEYVYFITNNQLDSILVSENVDKVLLENILTTFDSSIETVKESRDDDGSLNGFTVHFYNKESVHIGLNGEVSNQNRLSKGTYDAISLVFFFHSIRVGNKNKRTTTFFLDERMAYTHTELEVSMLNLMIEHLGKNSQLFYTTHNYDVLDMNIPIYSHTLVIKNNKYSYFIQPEKSFKKNDRRLLNYLKNNAFNNLPNTERIDEMLYG